MPNSVSRRASGIRPARRSATTRTTGGLSAPVISRTGRSSPSSPPGREEAGRVLRDGGALEERQVGALEDVGALLLRQLLPGPAPAPFGVERPRAHGGVAVAEDHLVPRRVVVMLRRALRGGEQDRLVEREAADEVRPVEREPKRDHGAEGMTDEVRRAHPLQ